MTAGRVTVNGVVARELGTKVDVERDAVAVDGVTVTLAARAAYLMLNKPAGVLTTMSDPQGRPCVAPLVPRDRFPGLFPVGRLDQDTTGLLLFTTDGDLAQRLLHPSHHVEKRYLAVVDGVVRDGELDALRRGITLDDGPCKPARCRIRDLEELRASMPRVPRSGQLSGVEIIISEGRKNQVKRMLSAIHHPVRALHRDHFGPLALGNLATGAWRALEHDEIARLRAAGERGEEATPQRGPSRPTVRQ